MDVGRRTIGLHKNDAVDSEQIRNDQYGGAKTEKEEKVLAVHEF